MKDRVVKLGLIGCGAIARQYHVPSLVNTPGCRVVAVCDLIRERADWAGSQFGLGPDRCFTDADELLSIPEIEGVVILTPNYNHCEMTVKAASYHKHVFITKPMARDTKECEKMIEACKNSGVQLFVSFMHRYLTGIREAREMIKRGDIGSVQMVRVLNAPGATSTVSSWFYRKENVGGGCVMDIGVHGIDIVRYLIGDITKVLYARTGRFQDRIFTDGQWVEPDNEDHAVAVYQTESGCLVNQVISWHHWSPADRFSMEVFGDKGTIMIRGAMGTLTVFRKDSEMQSAWLSPQIPYKMLGIEQHEAFCNMIRSGSSADPDGNEGLACIKVAKAVYEAEESGKEISL